MSKTYRLGCVWQCWGIVNIEAENIEQAIDIAREGPLPDGDYIDDSFEVDVEGFELLNEGNQEVLEDISRYVKKRHDERPTLTRPVPEKIIRRLVPPFRIEEKDGEKDGKEKR